jgi:hypothetical protein
MQFDVVEPPDAVVANEAARPIGPVVDSGGTEALVVDSATEGKVVLPEGAAADVTSGVAAVPTVVVEDCAADVVFPVSRGADAASRPLGLDARAAGPVVVDVVASEACR